MSIKCVDGGQLLLDFGYEKKPYIRDPHTITEQTGFLTPEQQVQRMMAAGVNLMNYRREFYDFPDGEVPDGVSPDPTQRLGFDPAEASQMLNAYASSLKGAEAPSQAPEVEGSGEKAAVSPATADESK